MNNEKEISGLKQDIKWCLEQLRNHALTPSERESIGDDLRILSEDLAIKVLGGAE